MASVREYLQNRRGRDDDRDRDDRGRGRDRDDDRGGRGRDRDDRDDDRGGRGRDRDDRDDDRGGSRRDHNPRAGRFTGMRSNEARYPLIEDDHLIVRVIKSFETEATPGASFFHVHFEVLDCLDRDPRFKKGEKCAILQSTGGKSFQAAGPRITQFVRGTSGFESDDDFIKAVPKLSKSGRAPYDELIDAVLGVRAAEKEFGHNPLKDRVVEVKGSKGKTGKNRNNDPVQYYEYAWIPVDQDEWEGVGGEGDDEDDRDTDRRGSRGRARDDEDDRPARGRSRDDDDRGREEPRSRGRGGDRDDDRGRGREDTREEEDDDRDDRRDRDREDDRDDDRGRGRRR